MFRPLFLRALCGLLLSFGLVTAVTAAARAQSVGDGASAEASIHARAIYQPHQPQAANSRTLAMLAQLSSEAGVPFFSKPEPQRAAQAATVEPPLCIRAGLGLNPAVLSGPQMTVEHGVLGCPTSTAGLPIVVVQGPALEAPPTSRAGEYDVNLTMRYRLMARKRMQVIATVTDQGLAYTLNSPISGNNLIAALTLIF